MLSRLPVLQSFQPYVISYLRYITLCIVLLRPYGTVLSMGHSQSKTSARGSKHHPQQTNSLQLFTYTPLVGPRNFRILHLARRRGEASVNHEDLELHASLVEASLDSVPEYFALSYTWGDPAPVGRIFINGRVLGITRNCADALQRMLMGKAERLIWVDSICINQGGMCVCRVILG
jgi:hypothetical protein